MLIELTEEQLDIILDAMEYAIDDREYEISFMSERDKEDTREGLWRWNNVLQDLYSIRFNL